jgi:hypothetical protein
MPKAPTIDEMVEKLKQSKPTPWDGGYCDRCQNTGMVDCHCGGDLCVCGAEELVCPRCHGESCGEAVNEDEDY